MQFLTPIFSNQVKNLLSDKYYQFENEIICDWLYNTYLGEHETTIVYPKLKNNFESDSYQDLNLSKFDKHTVCKYFDRMIHDEIEHIQLLLDLLQNNFKKNIELNDLIDREKQTNESLNSLSLSQLLSKYYVSECYLWTGFYLTYKNCQDSQTAQIFHRLVIDESHHNNNIYKMYQKLKHSICLDDHDYIQQVVKLRHFGLNYVKNFFGLNDEINKKNMWFLNLIYDHDWQRKFNLIFLKKTFKLYGLYHPECNINDYQLLIEKQIKKH